MEINKINAKDVAKILKHFKDGGEGVYWHKFTTLNDGKELCLVFGWQEGYMPDPKLIQRDGYTLCAKIAINIDDLQCDYDMDWYMPYYENGEVWDTETALLDDPNDCLGWFNGSAENIARVYNKGEISVK